MELVFLGTGGGRFVLSTQRRRTGGFLLKGDGFQIHCDPGPGALVNAWKAKESPMKTKYVFVSHQHTDHYNDAPAVIEAMTEGTREKKGVLVGSRMFIQGWEDETPGITNFHKSLVERVIVAEPGRKEKFEDFEVSFTSTVHGEPTGIGFVFDFEDLKLGYTSDTCYYPGMEDYFNGVDILILNTISPDLSHFGEIMTLGDAVQIVSKVKPKLAILTHFGMRALRFGPEKMAGILAEKTGVRSLAARDFMKLNLKEELEKKGLAGFI